MNIWEFMKFLAMLIPTWLLLAALALTLALPAKGGSQPSSVDATVPQSEEAVIANSDIEALPTVVVR